MSKISNIEALQKVWGRRGRYLVIVGVALSMMVHEIGSTTIFSSRPYALSAYNSVSLSTTLLTAGTILFAVCKALYAKLADVIWRGETYLIPEWRDTDTAKRSRWLLDRAKEVSFLEICLQLVSLLARSD